MPKLLMTVEEAFEITGRGLIVVPGPLAKDFAGAANLQAELRRPDGSIATASLVVQHFFQTPPPKEYRWGCLFPMMASQSK